MGLIILHARKGCLAREKKRSTGKWSGSGEKFSPRNKVYTSWFPVKETFSIERASTRRDIPFLVSEVLKRTKPGQFKRSKFECWWGLSRVAWSALRTASSGWLIWKSLTDKKPGSLERGVIKVGIPSWLKSIHCEQSCLVFSRRGCFDGTASNAAEIKWKSSIYLRMKL